MFAARWITAGLILATVRPALAQENVRTGPVDGRGLPPTDIDRVAVGREAPDFTLFRYGGGTVTLSDFRDSTNIVLLFYRGSWCRYCMGQLTELRSLLDPDLKANTTILAVSPDGERETRQTISRIGQSDDAPDIVFLSDPDHAVIDRYGLLNPSGSRRGIPHPATFVIDQGGIVQWRFVETDYRIRPSNDAVRTALLALSET